MKFRLPEIAIGALLAIAILAVGMSIGSSLLPLQKSEIYPSVAGHEARADDRIADYTWWLAVLTAGLVIVSGVQGYFLLRADKTARTAANAADLSARAAVAIELAIIQIKPNALSHGAIRDHPETEMVEHCDVHFVTFSNLGKTNAYQPN